MRFQKAEICFALSLPPGAEVEHVPVDCTDLNGQRYAALTFEAKRVAEQMAVTGLPDHDLVAMDDFLRKAVISEQ